MYRLHDYARMIADETRIKAYARALEAAVRPGHVVVDIGTGTGIFALVACKLGARRVYAIDNNDAVETARELARENACADRIEFIHDDARKIRLPERADVVVSDLRGAMPLAEGHLTTIGHAREHFLASGGRLIPQRDELRVAVVASARAYARAVGPRAAAGVGLGAMQSRLSNAVFRDRQRSIGTADLLTAGETWATIDYATVGVGTIEGSAEFRISNESEAHGLILWFDTELALGQGFSTAPGLDGVYPQLFLPWTEPVPLQQGDTVSVRLWASAEGTLWGWNTDIQRSGDAKRIRYKQSDFLGDAPRPQPLQVPLRESEGRAR